MTDNANRRDKLQWTERGSWAEATGSVLTAMIIERSAAARSGEASDQCEQAGGDAQHTADDPAALPSVQGDTPAAPAPSDDRNS